MRQVIAAKTAASIAFKRELRTLSGAAGEAPVCRLAVGLSHEQPFDQLKDGDDKSAKET